MEKTIKSLNEKLWYRLLKVIFVFIIVIVCSASITFFFSEYGKKEILDYNNSYIQCESGDKLEVYKSDTYAFGSLTYSAGNRYKSLCSGNYTFVSLNKEIGSWETALTYSIILIIVIYIIFEFIKRIFYYILLGSMMPKKK